MKILKCKKALSPVVASIILIAVTVAVSIAVAAWMGALSFTFMGGGERLKLGTPYGWTDTSVNVTATNEGGSKVIIKAARVQGYSLDVFTPFSDPIVVEPKDSKEVKVDISGKGNFTTGYEYTIILITTNNNEFRTTGVKP
jgi:flagellin-like protein